jgi:hypothetical protein
MNDLTAAAKDATRPCREVRVHINRFAEEGNMQLKSEHRSHGASGARAPGRHG